MAKKKKVRPVPRGYGTVQVSLNLSDAKGAMEFVKKAFGGKVRTVMPGPDGKIMHAELKLGDTVILFSDAVQEAERPANLFMYVPSVDKTFAKAVKAGGKVILPIADMFWGDRWGRLEDPYGNRWSIATHVEDVTPKQMKKRMADAAKK
jgi:PhnB protein